MCGLQAKKVAIDFHASNVLPILWHSAMDKISSSFHSFAATAVYCFPRGDPRPFSTSNTSTIRSVMPSSGPSNRFRRSSAFSYSVRMFVIRPARSGRALWICLCNFSPIKDFCVPGDATVTRLRRLPSTFGSGDTTAVIRGLVLRLGVLRWVERRRAFLRTGDFSRLKLSENFS